MPRKVMRMRNSFQQRQLRLKGGADFDDEGAARSENDPQGCCPPAEMEESVRTQVTPEGIYYKAVSLSSGSVTFAPSF